MHLDTHYFRLSQMQFRGCDFRLTNEQGGVLIPGYIYQFIHVRYVNGNYKLH